MAIYFPAEHLLNKLKISEIELRRFEGKGIVQGISKAGRMFYSSRDMFTGSEGLLSLMSRGLPLDEARWHADHPTQESAE